MGDITVARPLRIAYLGPSASFSHQASKEAFAPNYGATFHPIPSFKELFSAIQSIPLGSDEAYDYAVIPVENSTNGYVVQVLDILIQCGLNPDSSLFPDVEVVAEHYLEVHHCLYIHPSAVPQDEATTTSLPVSKLNITTLLTHPQAWGQCTKFLSKHFSPAHTERIDVSSTSAAAKFVAEHPPNSLSSDPEAKQPPGLPAAICSELAGIQNNLALVAANIEDEPGKNTTRFLIIQNSKVTQTLPPHLAQPIVSSITTARLHKSLLVFMVPHFEPGSLALALTVFRKYGFNMTGITTRPSRERNWHYAFFVECYKEAADETENDPSGLKELMRDLESATERLCWLGNWVDRQKYD